LTSWHKQFSSKWLGTCHAAMRVRKRLTINDDVRRNEMIAKMTKDGVLQVYAETEAEIYLLKCWIENHKHGNGASFEVKHELEPVEKGRCGVARSV